MSLLRRYLALSATVVVGAALVVLLLVGAAGPARWMASAFALAVAAYTSIGMVRDVLREHWGIDILAVTAVVSTVVVGEYGAALIIVLMMTGGEALETYAAGRASVSSRHCLTARHKPLTALPVWATKWRTSRSTAFCSRKGHSLTSLR